MRSMVFSVAALLWTMPASAQQMAPFFENSYSIENLGSIPGVPFTYGGCCFLAGNPNVLLVGGHANTAEGDIWAVNVTRDAQGHITGFAGGAAFFADAYGLGRGGIDGTLAYLPNGVLAYTTFPDNYLGQLAPGSSTPSGFVDLSDYVFDSVGGFVQVPPGFPGAGRFKFFSYFPSYWYDVDLVLTGSGFYDVTGASQITVLPGGPECALYVSGANPEFGVDVVLVSKFVGGRIDYYLLDADGDPIVYTEFPFIENLYGAEGMAFDPLTNDLIITTYDYGPYGGNELFVVKGFLPPPACTGDLNHDGNVDASDLATVLGSWGPCGGCAADLDGSGTVNAADLSILLGAWGPC
ncbi:MAG: dockerin type I domain-containing protein [Phycisphaerales bacterium]